MFIKIRTYSQSRRTSKLGSLSDEQLILFYLESRDKQVEAVLFDRYIHLVFASCMKYLREEQQAEDAAMEIFESLGEKLWKYDVHHFKSWLFMVTRNHCLMILRKKKTLNNLQNIEDFYGYSVENEFFLHQDFKENKNNLDILSRCLNELKVEQKICLELMYFKGKTYKDIALETGFEINKIKSYIQNGKRKLKLLLEGHEGK